MLTYVHISPVFWTMQVKISFSGRSRWVLSSFGEAQGFIIGLASFFHCCFDKQTQQQYSNRISGTNNRD